MKLNWMTSLAAVLVVFGAGNLSATAQATDPAPLITTAPVTTSPVYVPDISHANEPLPDGIIAWDELMKSTDATNAQDFARFTFTFTNATAQNLTILNVHPSCGCTTAEMPPVPWTLPGGTSGQIKLNVNLAGKSGTLFKTVNVSTDKGSKTLTLRINILAPVVVKMSENDRAKGVAAAMVDRQAVFKGDCASCHLPNIQGKYGQPLFAAVCAICHEAEPRASMVADLHNLQVPTNEEFWRAWITAGKAGSLMPAFATSQGGPLNDMQIASLAAYLNAVNPSRVPQPAPTTAPVPPTDIK
jgi:mono/diheme cytochrome c family protein